MDQDKIPFDDMSFGSAVLDNVLEHLEDPEPLLGEIHRVLAEKGILLVGVPGQLGYLKDPDHKVFYSKKQLIKTVSRLGFQVHHIFTMPLNILLLESILPQFCIYAVFIAEK